MKAILCFPLAWVPLPVFCFPFVNQIDGGMSEWWGARFPFGDVSLTVAVILAVAVGYFLALLVLRASWFFVLERVSEIAVAVRGER